MTTNSPYPVDVDVQALIEHIKQTLSVDDGAIGFRVYKIALAALTAEPVGNFYEDGKDNWWQLGPHDKTPHVTPLYTTPPAQLLRPVELPEFKVHSNQPCWPSIAVGLRDEEWIEALRQQGYEVKS